MAKMFEKDGHKIFWGDALQVLSEEISDNSIDLIFADPPYNIGKSFNFTEQIMQILAAEFRTQAGTIYEASPLLQYLNIKTRSAMRGSKARGTGRTNANDGGIDFVMRPLGRFFQVTETLDVRKYFLDIDKVEHYPVSFVIKSAESADALRQKL